jgi:glutamate-1-semialdehyde 2,1-aminomutase
VLQQGTFNANPLSAAAGVSMLTLIARGEANGRCDQLGAQLRNELNEVFERRGVAGCVVGESSVFQILLGAGMDEAYRVCDVDKLMAERPAARALRKAMLLEGVDLMRTGGFVSTRHTDAELKTTVRALDRGLERLQIEGLA